MEIRDKRNKEWFIVDNIYLNGYARIFGPIGSSVYLSLCRHADNETQKCFPSMELIAEEIAISRQTVGKYISLLEGHGLISVQKNISKKDKKRENNIYTLLDKSNWRKEPCKTDVHGAMSNETQKPCQTDSESHVNPVNSNNTHINNTQLTTGVQSPRDEIAEIIKEFESINPACKRHYGNTTQRKAVTDLIAVHSFDRVIHLIRNVLPKTNLLAYAPNITTPLQLFEKYSQLENSVKKIQSKTQHETSKITIVNGIAIKG